jgi:hypothetical protein
MILLAERRRGRVGEGAVVANGVHELGKKVDEDAGGF